MIRRLGALALAALPAACLSIPSYQPQIAVSYTEDATGATVAGTGFALHFPATGGFRFPDQLTVDGDNVLAPNTGARCDEPSEPGVELSPGYRISSDSLAAGAVIARNELHPVLRGPAAVQIELDWAVHLGTSQHTPGGRSTFTVFLDGRIVRHDRIEDAGTPAASPSSSKCPGAAGNNFDIASYWTFTRQRFSALYTAHRPRDLRVIHQDPQAQTAINDDRFTCLDAGATAYQVSSAVRVPAGETDGNLLALVIGDAFTFAHHRPIDGSDLGSFQWDDHSAVFIDRHGCMPAFDRANDYLAPAQITVGPATVALSENDGIYGGDPGDGSAPGVPLAGDVAELAGPVTSSFAVWLRFPHAVDVLRATWRGGPAPAGAWYVPQQVDGRSWILWFRDPLPAMQTIRIEPN
jgi:hypothetical protein